MIQSNIQEVQKELQDYKLVFEQKLKAMVVGLAGDIALEASKATPVATPETIERVERLYMAREKRWNIEIAPGFHAGAWKYVEGTLTIDPKIYTEEQVDADARKEARAQYQIGDTFAIGAIGPGFADLEGGSSPHAENGILKPTKATIVAAFGSNLKRYFESKK
jgi:hypothetical protein